MTFNGPFLRLGYTFLADILLFPDATPGIHSVSWKEPAVVYIPCDPEFSSVHFLSLSLFTCYRSFPSLPPPTEVSVFLSFPGILYTCAGCSISRPL